MQNPQHPVLAPQANDNYLEIDIATLWNAVISRYKLCLAVGGVFIGIALAYCLLATPTYQATARLLAVSGTNQTTEFKPAVEIPRLDNRTFIATQIKALSARDLLNQLFNKFHLGEAPCFATSQDPLAMLEKRLVIKQVPNTAYIDIGVLSEDPQQAADMANALCEFFIVGKQNQANSASKIALGHLKKELQLAEAEREKGISEINAFREQYKWPELRETAQSTAMLLTEFKKKLIEAQSGNQSIQQIEDIRRQQKEAADILATYDRVAERHELLEDKLDLAKEMHQILIKRITQLEVAINTNSGISGIFSIVTRATPPIHKAQPKRMMIMAVSLLASAILCVLLCVLLEMRDKSIKSKAELLRITRLPILGTLTDRSRSLSSVAARLCSLNQGKTFALAPVGGFSKRMEVSHGLAQVCAQLGYKTILIDADIEANKLDAHFASTRIDLTSEPKLPSRLACIPESDVKFISIGADGAGTNNNFNRESLKKLLRQCEKQFDVVLVQIADISTSPRAHVICLDSAVQTVLLLETHEADKNVLVDFLQTDIPFGFHPIGSVFLETKRPVTRELR